MYSSDFLIEPHDPLPDCDCHACSIAERNRLRSELKESDDLRDLMADILRRTAIALRGPEPALTRWGWHDLPERASASIAAIAVMQGAAKKLAEDQHNDGVGRPAADRDQEGPPGTYGCACVSNNAHACAEIRFGYMEIPEPCECLCHDWRTEDDDLG